MKINPVYFVLLFALLGVSIYLNGIQFKADKAAKSRIELLEKTSSKQSAVITRYIAPDSSEHVVYKEVYAKTDAEKELAVSRGYVDSLRKALDIKTGQIAELTRIKATVTATVKTKASTDSSGNKRFSYTNKWLDFQLNTADSLLHYKYNVELSDVKYYRGNWLTGRTWYRDVSIADPNASINGIDRFTLPPERKKRVGVGVQAGYYYNPVNGQMLPAVGVGVSYNLINF